MHASSWQRSLIGIAMVAGGVVLVLLGHTAGALLAVAAILLLWRVARRVGHPGRGRSPGGAEP